MLIRIEALWVGETTRIDIYYLKERRWLNPLLRKMQEMGFIPYWEYVSQVRDEEHTLIER